MMRILVAGVAALVGLVVTINGAVMLASPRFWFRLPPWLGYHGSLTEDKYGVTWGGVQVRLTGLLILVVTSWVLYELIVR